MMIRTVAAFLSSYGDLLSSWSSVGCVVKTPMSSFRPEILHIKRSYHAPKVSARTNAHILEKIQKKKHSF